MGSDAMTIFDVESVPSEIYKRHIKEKDSDPEKMKTHNLKTLSSRQNKVIWEGYNFTSCLDIHLINFNLKPRNKLN